jgi:hypothetical protein
LIFYYILSREEKEKRRLAAFFELDFFEDLEDGFIKDGDKWVYKAIFAKMKPKTEVAKARSKV